MPSYQALRHGASKRYDMCDSAVLGISIIDTLLSGTYIYTSRHLSIPCTQITEIFIPSSALARTGNQDSKGKSGRVFHRVGHLLVVT